MLSYNNELDLTSSLVLASLLLITEPGKLVSGELVTDPGKCRLVLEAVMQQGAAPLPPGAQVDQQRRCIHVQQPSSAGGDGRCGGR